MTATVVIVGYRAYAELEQCLASLASYEPTVPVVVIDHAADLAEASRLSAAFPRVAYRPPTRTPGSARASTPRRGRPARARCCC